MNDLHLNGKAISEKLIAASEKWMRDRLLHICAFCGHRGKLRRLAAHRSIECAICLTITPEEFP